MQVVLLERVEKLGQMGEVVSVKDGYARNFLLPQGKALRATEANMERFEQQRAQIEAKNLERRNEADSVAKKLNGEAFIIIRQAGEAGQLYGSVATRDIADAVTENGFTIERAQVVLDRPIKALGLHPLKVRLHPEVTVEITVNVARSQDEAERQARGEDVTIELTDEEEEALALAKEVFENEELAKEAAAELSENEGEESEASEGSGAEKKAEEEKSE